MKYECLSYHPISYPSKTSFINTFYGNIISAICAQKVPHKMNSGHPHIHICIYVYIILKTYTIHNQRESLRTT